MRLFLEAAQFAEVNPAPELPDANPGELHNQLSAANHALAAFRRSPRPTRGSRQRDELFGAERSVEFLVDEMFGCELQRRLSPQGLQGWCFSGNLDQTITQLNAPDNFWPQRNQPT
jgi:hypothetical protein